MEDDNKKEDPSDNEPTIFLAKQMIEIRDQLKTDMDGMKKEMSDMISASHKKDMDEMKNMIKDLLND